MPSYGSRMPPWPSGPLTENVKDGDPPLIVHAIRYTSWSISRFCVWTPTAVAVNVWMRVQLDPFHVST